MEIFIFKAKTRQEVAEEYGICVKTLISRLAEANIILGRRLIFPKTLEIIYETCGCPQKFENVLKSSKMSGFS